MNFSCNNSRMAALCLFALAAAPLAAQHIASATTSANAMKSEMTGSPIERMGAGSTLHILVGQSAILRDAAPMRRIYVGNPAVLQTFTASPQEVVVTAKTAGVSSLVIWDTLEHSTMYTVHTDIDPTELKRALSQAYPDSHIDVAVAEDRVSLSGTVPTTEVMDGANKLAALYGSKVVNSIRVVQVHGKQVELKLRIVEVDRTKITTFGFNLAHSVGGNIGVAGTGQFPSTFTATPSTGGLGTVTVDNPLTIWFYNGAHNIGASIQDLQQHNLLQILAEPTLTTLSGDTARFLSGGEFPFPVVQGGGAGVNSSAITIQFRPYGVKVEFTPTVNADGTVHLKLMPEVSTLDYANAVTISGFTVPALSTRRAETEIELRDGQTFMISGLLNRTTTDSLSKIPGIADIPILGQLFKSKSLTHGVSELVILVTANVVDPLTQTSVPATPKTAAPELDQKKFDHEVDGAEKTYPRN